jgi:hypothetical protein
MAFARLVLPFSAAVALTWSPTDASAQSSLVLTPLRMDQVMTPAQLEHAGLGRLTREQRLVLDAWLTRYSAELRRAGSDPTPAASIVASGPGDDGAGTSPNGASEDQAGAVAELNAAPRGRRAVAQLCRDRLELVPITAPLGARLVEAEDDRGYLRLADGTLWEIALPDRPVTDAWRGRDYVVVSRAPASVGEYDHVLVNANARTQAFARFAGLVQQRRR